jgi:hypothetical protein
LSIFLLIKIQTFFGVFMAIPSREFIGLLQNITKEGWEQAESIRRGRYIAVDAEDRIWFCKTEEDVKQVETIFKTDEVSKAILNRTELSRDKPKAIPKKIAERQKLPDDPVPGQKAKLREASRKVNADYEPIQDQIVNEIVKTIGKDFLTKSKEERRKDIWNIAINAIREFRTRMAAVIEKYPSGSCEHTLASACCDSGGGPRFRPINLQKEIEQALEEIDSDDSYDLSRP